MPPTSTCVHVRRHKRLPNVSHASEHHSTSYIADFTIWCAHSRNGAITIAAPTPSTQRQWCSCRRSRATTRTKPRERLTTTSLVDTRPQHVLIIRYYSPFSSHVARRAASICDRHRHSPQMTPLDSYTSAAHTLASPTSTPTVLDRASPVSHSLHETRCAGLLSHITL